MTTTRQLGFTPPRHKRTIINKTDYYKVAHWDLYPRLTQYVYAYWEARMGAKYNATTMAGLQALLKQDLCGPVITAEGIARARAINLAMTGNPALFNEAMWQHILEKHEGWLPLRIKAVLEGTRVPVGNVMMTVENTDVACFPLTNYVETPLSRLWYPATVATLSREIRLMYQHYLNITAEADMHWIADWCLHDFGARGVSSGESAEIGGAAHLINGKGTDTLEGLDYIVDYYNGPDDYSGIAGSVVATEHSIMTSLGKFHEETNLQGDLEMLHRHLLAHPTGILSEVIDSFDYRAFIDGSAKFKDIILARDGKLVYRPDSGEPQSVTLDVFERLGRIFGYTVNKKGYKVLNPKVGVLWGDGIDYDGIRSILFTLTLNKWCTACIVFGQGGGLLQKVNRDTQRFAFKSSAQCRDGKWYDIAKSPIETSKASKAGRLALIERDGTYVTIRESELESPEQNKLVTIFENGQLLVDQNFEDIRARARA